MEASLARGIGLECMRQDGEPPEKPGPQVDDNPPFSLAATSANLERMSGKKSQLSIEEEVKKLHEETLRHFGLGPAESPEPPQVDPQGPGVASPGDQVNKSESTGQSLVLPSDVESGITCSHLLTGEISVCGATTRSGRPCRANVRAGEGFCAFHHPRAARAVSEGRAAGGRRSPYVMPAQADPDLSSIGLTLYSQSGIQASLEAIMRMILLGRIPASHAGILIRCFNVATRNLHSSNNVVRARDAAAYRHRVNEVLRAAGLIERDLQQPSTESGSPTANKSAAMDEVQPPQNPFGQ